jgi:hypothetical protein
MRAFVVVFGLVGGECLGAVWEGACIGLVAGVQEEVPAEFGALFEVFRVRVAVFPLAEAARAFVDMGQFDVFVEGFWGREGGVAGMARGEVPFANAGLGGVVQGCGSWAGIDTGAGICELSFEERRIGFQVVYGFRLC